MNDPSQKHPTAVLEEALERVRSAVSAPGISAGMSHSGHRIAASTGYADLARSWPMQATSRYGIACITKLLLAIVACKLSRKKVISLDDPIECHLAKSEIADFRRRITMRELLSHTGGYQGPLIYGIGHREFNWAMFAAQLCTSRQTFAAGQVFNYENTGHVIAGFILETVTERKINDLINEFVFAPLGILPGVALKDYKDQSTYVAPHRIDMGVARSVAPTPFGHFWKSSLADITLSVSDFISIGEAIVGLKQDVDFGDVREELQKRLIEIPRTVSGKNREHSPAFFNSICAEYGSGWYGYAGSALGQTCGLRFDLKSKSVCVVAINAWLPIARDTLLDRLCNTVTHLDAGLPGGNIGFNVRDLVGDYSGGGNIIRSVRVTAPNSEEIHCAFGADGIPGPVLRFPIDSDRRLVPDPSELTPGVGFFAEPETGIPCMLIGVGALKKIF